KIAHYLTKTGQVMGDFYGKRRFICEMFTCFTIKNEKSLRLTRTLQVSRQSEKSAACEAALFVYITEPQPDF
ncbi:hypothetical protein, partial [Priestia flexa]|uniref:hypothetical protein n=1 Tax=Priestia flexa TaxID=86664 RepID=UPI001C930CF9